MTTLFNLTGNVTLATLSTLNQDIECLLYQGKPITPDLTPDDQTNLRHIDSWYKQFTFINNLAKAVNRDRFVKILSVFDNRLKNPNSSMKWTFLSGHDLDMVATYNDLNLSSSQCIEELYRKGQTSALNCESFPEFAASLIFELYTDGTTHTIKIRSNGRYMNMCEQNSTECKYEDWKKRVEGNMANDQLVNSICGNKSKAVIDGEKELGWEVLRDHNLIF
jgi:lysosomal acid phosphatase